MSAFRGKADIRQWQLLVVFIYYETQKFHAYRFLRRSGRIEETTLFLGLDLGEALQTSSVIDIQLFEIFRASRKTHAGQKRTARHLVAKHLTVLE